MLKSTIIQKNIASPWKQESFAEGGNLKEDCFVQQSRLDEFNSLSEELDGLSFDCVCVFSPVRGDVAQLLQLYRYKISDSDAVKRFVDIALHNKVHCYLPSDSLGEWIYVGDGDNPKRAQQISCEEEDCFLFKLI